MIDWATTCTKNMTTPFPESVKASHNKSGKVKLADCDNVWSGFRPYVLRACFFKIQAFCIRKAGPEYRFKTTKVVFGHPLKKNGRT